MKSNTLPLTLLCLSMLVIVATSSWMMIWLLMEINMIGMAMVLMAENNKEKTILFFLFQSFPSIALLIVTLMSWLAVEENINPTTMSAIMLAMICKMGMFPLHTWILKMSKSVSWLNNLIMMTIQKVVPVIIMLKIMLIKLMYVVASVSIMAMTIMMLYCTSAKMMLMASSMAHMSWIILAMTKLKLLCLVYLAIYSMIITPIVKHLKKHKSQNVTNQNNKVSSNQMSHKINMMSLSGLPPLTGFLLKAMVIYLMIFYKTPAKIVIITLISATGAFFVYSQMMVKTLALKGYSKKDKKNTSVTNAKTSISVNMMLPMLLMMK